MPAQERRPTMMPMTKATTTPLVRQFFEHLFKDQLAKGDKFTSNLNVSKSGRCGVCVPCLRQVSEKSFSLFDSPRYIVL